MSTPEGSSEPASEHVVRARGLPWSTTLKEIQEFFTGVELLRGESGIHMTLTDDGRPSGEAYIELASEEEIEKALKRNRNLIGNRYIEVFRADITQMNFVLDRVGEQSSNENGDDDSFVRLRGLPYSCKKEDIVQFLEGLEIAENGISMLTNYMGRKTGEAYVRLSHKDDVDKALERNKKTIGHRYIEVFRSSSKAANHHYGKWGHNEETSRKGRSGPYGRPKRRFNKYSYESGGSNYQDFNIPPLLGNYNYNPGDRHVVRMRGLPYQASEMEIADWFAHLAHPVDVQIHYDNRGRSLGKADAYFASANEARKAMLNDRLNMQHRYVELFYEPPYEQQPYPLMGYKIPNNRY